MSTLLKYYGDFDTPIPEHIGGKEEKKSCDLIVIGSGGAGLSAAVRAAQQGKKVIIIEKMSVLGGNSRLAGGILCTNSKIQQEKGMPDMTEEHIDTYRRAHMYTLDDSIFTRFIRNTGTTFDWLVSLGLDAENTRPIMDKVLLIKERSEWGPLRNPAYGPGLMGTAITNTLIAALATFGCEVLLETEVTDLVVEDGAVTGVKAVGNGCDYSICASNCVLATGGFGSNNEMLIRFFPKYFDNDNLFTHYCLSHCTGDGITMAEKIGAKVGELMSIGLESMVHMPGEYSLQLIQKRPEGIIVSDNGKRFMPEDDMDNGEFALDKQPKGEAWYLVNEANIDKIFQIACDNGRYGDWLPDLKILHDDLEIEIANGLTKKGETIADLANQIGADPAVLEETITDYAAYCVTKKDRQFCKNPEYLLELGADGPWYAIRITRKFDVTMGGVSINSKMEALRPDGSVIPGLYVCGDIASGWMGENYGPLFSSFAWALNSGYLAADEICSK